MDGGGGGGGGGGAWWLFEGRGLGVCVWGGGVLQQVTGRRPAAADSEWLPGGGAQETLTNECGLAIHFYIFFYLTILLKYKY